MKRLYDLNVIFKTGKPVGKIFCGTDKNGSPYIVMRIFTVYMGNGGTKSKKAYTKCTVWDSNNPGICVAMNKLIFNNRLDFSANDSIEIVDGDGVERAMFRGPLETEKVRDSKGTEIKFERIINVLSFIPVYKLTAYEDMENESSIEFKQIKGDIETTTRELLEGYNELEGDDPDSNVSKDDPYNPDSSDIPF